jgi:KUP system potassium uptake protein
VAAAGLFVIVDLVTAHMTKVLEGGWVPLAAGAMLFFCHRRGGKASLHWRKNLERDRTVLKEFIAGVHASRLGAIRPRVGRGHAS